MIKIDFGHEKNEKASKLLQNLLSIYDENMHKKIKSGKHPGLKLWVEGEMNKIAADYWRDDD